VVIRDREILARDGFLLVSINLNRETGQIIGQPEIISRGFVYLREAEPLMETVRETVEEVLSSNGSSKNGRLHENLQEAIRRVLYNETKRRPMVFSVINER
jgi:ribonuclease J